MTTGSPSAAPPARPGPARPGPGLTGPRVLAVPVLCGAALLGSAFFVRGVPGLFFAFMGAGGTLLAWAGALAGWRRDSAPPLTLTAGVYRHHWVQALAQLAVLLYWGWYVRSVFTFFPLIVAQIVFAYGVDALLSWSRRRTWAAGFGPIPVVFSINLFLWFRPEWFHWQFVMILLGYLGKDLIRWQRDGRSRHIFNPSSFPLAVFALVLIATRASDITFGEAIATTQFYPPRMYLVIFLAALPGQLLFGVARMTLPAVGTLYAISLVFQQVTGTYLFYDVHIPVPVFLGMHLLFTDPSTSPRSNAGRVLYGVLYGVGVAVLYPLLTAIGVPTFYDKLLPVPILNLMVRLLDRVGSLRPGAAARRLPHPAGGPAGPVPAPRPATVYRGSTGLWVALFAVMTLADGVGHDQRGQSILFWTDACTEGNARACDYAATMLGIYCGDGSGWACNEWGVRRAEAGSPAGGAFARACELGFGPGCRNALLVGDETVGGRPPDARGAAGSGLATGPPRAEDLPVVLRGTRPPLVDASPGELRALACERGWEVFCAAAA